MKSVKLGLSATMTVTCDLASFLFRDGKERLIQLLDYLSVLLVQNLDFSLIGQETIKVIKTKP